MKRFLVTMACLMSAYAYGETTLRIPIFVEGVPSAAKSKQSKKNETRSMPATWFNSILKKAGIQPLPENIEYSNGDKYDTSEISARIDEISKQLGKGYENLALLGELTPNDNHAGDIKTCYTGRADGVWDLVASLGDVRYSEQMGLWGWKYHDKTVYDKEGDVKQIKELLKDTKVWTNWKGKDDAVLILTHVGDGGDDIAVSIIDRCDD